MSMLGIQLNVMIGRTVPRPAPRLVTEYLDQVEVTHKDQGRSGFQLTFKTGRAYRSPVQDFHILAQRLVHPRVRVILTVTFGGVPRVLSDGIITHQQLVPGKNPGESRLTVTGEDVSMAMDRDEVEVEHPVQPEAIIALKIVGSYAQYGLLPEIIPPPVIDMPHVDRTPVQRQTDLAYLKQMAGRYGYVFYVKPGPAPGLNHAYWGPPIRFGMPQRALSVNMGPLSNVDSLSFSYDGEKAARVSGHVQDSISNEKLPVETFFNLRIPLVSRPPLPLELPFVRTLLPDPPGGLNIMQALARAQGRSDAAVDGAVTASGELDTLRYGGILEPRGLVGVRGAGYEYGGFYYVKQVTHKIAKDSYRQSFQLTREGLGALLPWVPV